MAKLLTRAGAAFICAALIVGVTSAAAESLNLDDHQAAAVCGQPRSNENCGPGKGRQTPGGGEKVSHKGWPKIRGILWQVLGRHDSSKTGSHTHDELLGHHGSDRIKGEDGSDVIWGDWNPVGNTTRQRDTLIGGPGNDWIYPSHGTTTVYGGAGNDYVWAFYGKGIIDCGPGKDRARVRLNKAFKVRNCETILHFCTFGSNGRGGCLKPGEKRVVRND